MTAATSPRKKRRNLQSNRKARLHQLYSSDDVIKLYEISRNTLTNWIAGGLGFIEAEQRLFRGSELNAFHNRRRVKAAGECLGLFSARCFGCKRSHSMLAGEISVSPGRTPGLFRVSKICPDTGVWANRFFGREDLETLHRFRETSLGSETPD